VGQQAVEVVSQAVLLKGSHSTQVFSQWVFGESDAIKGP
jgi:hypothetical protein